VDIFDDTLELICGIFQSSLKKGYIEMIDDVAVASIAESSLQGYVASGRRAHMPVASTATQKTQVQVSNHQKTNWDDEDESDDDDTSNNFKPIGIKVAQRRANIYILCGDIYSMKVDAIVSPVNRKLEHFDQLLFDRAGDNVRAAWKHLLQQVTQKRGFIDSTKGGDLPAKIIIHASMSHSSDQPNVIGQVMLKADQGMLDSIAVPVSFGGKITLYLYNL
jgi:hypothetical protein